MSLSTQSWEESVLLPGWGCWCGWCGLSLTAGRCRVTEFASLPAWLRHTQLCSVIMQTGHFYTIKHWSNSLVCSEMENISILIVASRCYVSTVSTPHWAITPDWTAYTPPVWPQLNYCKKQWWKTCMNLPHQPSHWMIGLYGNSHQAVMVFFWIWFYRAKYWK